MMRKLFATQLTFTRSKSTIETLKRCEICSKLTKFFSVDIVDFQQVNVSLELVKTIKDYFARSKSPHLLK